jgi:hypothetical protein
MVRTMTAVAKSNLFVALSATAVVAFTACSSTSDPPAAGDAGASSSSSSSSSSSGGSSGSSGASDGGADAKPDAPVPDGGGSGKACAFNRECPSAERCECSESAGCVCKTGPRGTGKNGVDTCKDGNDCESSLCVEGPASGTAFYCSDECTTAAQCKGALPVCADIALVGRICVRTP